MGLWIWCGNENPVFTIGWKKFADTKKGAAGQVDRESHVDGFFDMEGVVHHEFLCQGQTVNESLVLSWSAETSKRKCQEKNTSVVEKQLLVLPT
jgi:hypothetical protein